MKELIRFSGLQCSGASYGTNLKPDGKKTILETPVIVTLAIFYWVYQSALEQLLNVREANDKWSLHN